MNTSEILAKAADLIDERGHCKRVSEDLDGRLCVYGALRKATEQFVDQDRVFGAAAERISEHLGGDLVAIWNDYPERTKEEVVSALRSAAEAARAET